MHSVLILFQILSILQLLYIFHILFPLFLLGYNFMYLLLQYYVYSLGLDVSFFYRQ